MKQKTLGKKEVKTYNETIEQLYGAHEFFLKNDIVSIVGDRIIVRNKQPCFFLKDGKILPTLKLLEVQPLLKIVTVDLGALKFLIKGADIFRPGVVDVDDHIVSGQLICVVDHVNKKPIAIGYALFDSENMRQQTAGKAVTNIHHRGDSIWNSKLE